MKTLKMKHLNICLALLLLIVPIFSFSQENGRDSKNKFKAPIADRTHELKLGFAKILTGPSFDIEYERILSNSTSIGSNLVISVDNSYGNLISGFFRFYFTETKEYGTEGFFAQPVIGYYGGESDDYDVYLSDENFNAFGMGFGLGKKWVNKAGFIFQFSIGGLRTISGNEAAPEALFMGDLYMGYRF